MGLLGNQTRSAFGSGKQIGGMTAMTAGANRNYGEWKCWAAQEGKTTILTGAAKPTGYYPPATYYQPQIAGEISMQGSGAGSLAAFFYNSRNMQLAITGVGIFAADIQGRYNTGVALSGAGGLTADIQALGNLLIDLAGSGDLEASVAGGVDLGVALSGAGDLSAVASLIISMVLAMTGQGGLDADVVGGINLSVDFDGAGDIDTDINGRYNTAIALSGTGDLEADILAVGNMLLALTGVGDLEATIAAYGNMSVDVVLQEGSGLSVSQIVQGVMDHPVDGGYTFEQVTKLVGSIMGGKTQIVDNGNGTASITFRNLSDTTDMVIFDMDGSERTDRTEDL